MKNILLIVLAFICLNGSGQEAKKYLVKSGYLKLELSGNTTGTKELWWDDYGQKSCELENSTTTTKMFGMKNTEKKHMLTILVKDRFWTVNYEDGTAAKGILPYYNDAQEFAGSMTEQEQQEFADEMLNQLGGKRLATEELNGYKCDVIKLMGAKSWIYKGINLKTEAKVLGIETNEMFTAFKPNSSVPASKFTPPTDVEFEDMNQTANGFMGAFAEMDDFEEEDEEEIIPVDYSYEKFKETVEACKIEGYTCARTSNVEGVFTAAFMNGQNILMVMLQHEDNIEADNPELLNFQPFKHRGHTCRYGSLEEESGSALLVEYPSDAMNLMLVAIPEKNKEELLQIEKKLQF